VELREAFSILEIEEGSSLDEVKTDYRRLCIVWHPDRFQNPELKAHAEEKLKRINLAFDTIKSSTAEGESAVDIDPIVYQDLICRYWGGDARLWELSEHEFTGRPCAVQITPDGLLLVTFRDEQMDQFANYSPNFFVSLLAPETVRTSVYPYEDAKTEEWIRPVDKTRYFSNRLGEQPPKDQLTIEMRYPEGILPHSMHVKLTFRSGTYAQLFTKQMREAWGLVKFVRTVPKHKTVDENRPFPYLALMGFLLFWLVILFIAAMQ